MRVKVYLNNDRGTWLSHNLEGQTDHDALVNQTAMDLAENDILIVGNWIIPSRNILYIEVDDE